MLERPHQEAHLSSSLHCLIHHSLLLANGNNELVCLPLLLLHNDLLLLQRLLKVRHLGAGLRDLVHSVLKALLAAAEVLALDLANVIQAGIFVTGA